MVYDEGFEVQIEDKKFVAFFNWTKIEKKTISHCGQTTTGWYHENAVKASNWGCFFGERKTQEGTVNVHDMPAVKEQQVDALFHDDLELINAINREQSSWVAGPSTFQGMRVTDVKRMAGKRVPAYKRLGKVSRTPVSAPLHDNYPDYFNWVNKSMVTSVKQQGGCGSCFAFATLGMYVIIAIIFLV